MTETVFVHVGAHRTGSTHFQITMGNNRRILARASCRFIHLQKVPGFTRSMLRMRKGAEARFNSADRRFGKFAARYQRILADHADAKVLLLTAEGQLGEMGFSRRRAALYPAHGEIIRELAKLLSGRRVVAALSIRSYDGYVESTYKHMVRSSRQVLPFRSYAKQADLPGLTWLPIVEALIEAFGQESVVVWSYEAYAADLPRFYAWLFRTLGLEVAPETFGVHGKPRNPSPSTGLLIVQRAINRVVAATLPRKRSVRVARKWNTWLGQRLADHMRSKPSVMGSKPSLLPEGLKRQLAARYSADLKRIGALLPETSYL